MEGDHKRGKTSGSSRGGGSGSDGRGTVSEEVRRAAKGLRGGKASGMDNIPNKFLREGGDNCTMP